MQVYYDLAHTVTGDLFLQGSKYIQFLKGFLNIKQLLSFAGRVFFD